MRAYSILYTVVLTSLACALCGCDESSTAPTAQMYPVFRVPEEFRTIKEALSRCAKGDTVDLAPGTYHEFEIDVPAGISLRGRTSDPLDVTIDGQEQGHVLNLLPDPGDSHHRILVDGISITGGSEGGIIGSFGPIYIQSKRSISTVLTTNRSQAIRYRISSKLFLPKPRRQLIDLGRRMGLHPLQHINQISERIHAL